MTRFPRPGVPQGAGPPDRHADEYATWDGAYVLGSLSNADRREYEAHLSTCESCREAVSEIRSMPAWLARLDRADAVAFHEAVPQDAHAPPPRRPELLTSLMIYVRRRRRQSRLLTWAGAVAAAAALVIGVLVALQSDRSIPAPTPPEADASVLSMMRVGPNSLSATVGLTAHPWGTRIQMICTYGEEARDATDRDGDTLAMVLVGRDRNRSRVSTWTAVPGATASVAATTSMSIDEIAAVQVVSAENGEVLLQRNL